MRYRALFFSIGLLFSSMWAQPTAFDFTAYSNYLNQHENIDYSGLAAEFPAPIHYYSSLENSPSPVQFAYWDSIKIKLKLTPDELTLLKRNHFVVTERLSEYNFGSAYYQIFGKDLPVMVTTDFILHGLHQSYDKILLELEIGELEPYLHRALTALRGGFADLTARYSQVPELLPALQDVDVYLTMAMSLLENELQAPNLASPDLVRRIWILIEQQIMAEEALFTTQPRIYDFSQFTVRGHYDFTYYTPNGEKNLGNYFKAMMWLSQIDFLITLPPGVYPFPLADLQRQSIAAMLLNELIFTTDASVLYDKIDDVLQFMVGDSDNLTPHELQQLAAANGIANPADLLDPVQFANFQQALKTNAMAGQQILSNIFILDPFSSEPDTLPVSYRVMGQRFVLDSYVLGNLVFPN
ncbi:DUF3160 domain-containing protein, partial [bacterium]|nr:DUF3160 domain-containing protein [bacterium]